MLIKLAALGTLGYFGYRYYDQNKDKFMPRTGGEPEVALAGGPLSDQARLETSDRPAADWPGAKPHGTV